MPEYIYKGKAASNNKVVKGEGEFSSEKEAKEYLLSIGIIPVKVSKKTALNTDLSEVGIFKEKIKTSDMAFFCKQFAVMLEAGISIGVALELAGKQCINKNLQTHLKNINNQVKAGKSLSEAMLEEHVFPDILKSMVESGETSGNLDFIFNRLSAYFENQASIQRKVKKALMYPAIVLIVIIIAMAIIMIKVIPSFVDIFTETGAQLPWATKLLIATSQWFVHYWIVLFILIGVLGFALKYFKNTKQGKTFFDHLILKLPAFGKLNKKVLTSLFSETLALLNDSGVPILRSMEIVERVLNNTVASFEMHYVIEALKQGNTLSRALKTSQIYPELLVAMISIGEETGALDKMLAKTGEYFNEEVQTAMDQTMTLIEPILTVLIAIVVGIMMIAVILPTFSLATALM